VGADDNISTSLPGGRSGISPYRLINGILFAILLAITVFLFGLNVDASGRITGRFSYFFSEYACPYSSQGIECPSCGMTRSLVSLMDGDMRSSLIFHRCGILVFSGLLLELLIRGILLCREYERLWPYDLIGHLFLFVVAAVMLNVPLGTA